MYPFCHAMPCHFCCLASMPRRLCLLVAFSVPTTHARTRAQLMEVKWEEFLRAEALKEAVNNWKLAFPGEASVVNLSRLAWMVLAWSPTCVLVRYDVARESDVNRARCAKKSMPEACCFLDGSDRRGRKYRRKVGTGMDLYRLFVSNTTPYTLHNQPTQPARRVKQRCKLCCQCPTKICLASGRWRHSSGWTSAFSV